MQNEGLNGGGTLFVAKHPGLRVRVVHGNTLTAAVILREIPEGTAEVFLTGATSKLGRAIALYLCRKRVRVMVCKSARAVMPAASVSELLMVAWWVQMLTASEERFQKIQEEAPPEAQQYLVRVTKCQSAQHCKVSLIRPIILVC